LQVRHIAIMLQLERAKLWMDTFSLFGGELNYM